ncbi:alpha/beta fold hydrolase [Kutzneria chonburiensis]|uniref:Alpha/beta fold hydrolase n=1 Tax=Kutzneria chonburiensis TaxID=1483604 RepID=A0ABV6NAC9_9PSEU|nr:alpha/beta hydrolase [Kutzneria chonburiensis]
MGRIGGFKDSGSVRHYREIYARVRAQWPPGAEDLRVDTRFGGTHVIRHGTGPPVVLVPGSGATAANWVPNAGALAASYTVIALDTLGYPGLGTQIAPIGRPVDLALWLEDVLDGLGIDTAHVGGLSYGAWASMQLAWHAPRRVDSLLLLEPGGNSIGRPPLRALPTFLRMLVNRTEAEYERFGRLVEGGWPNDPDRQRLVNYGLAHYRSSVPMIRYASDEQLHRLRMPSLVLLGENSIVHDASKVRTRVRRLMPEACVEIIPGAPHPLAETHAEVVNEKVLAFLKSHG